MSQQSAIQELYLKLYESAAESIIIVDSEGKIVSANKSSETLFGYSAEELLALRVEELVPRKAREKHTSLRKSYDENPHHRKMGAGMELTAVRKDGSEVPVEISLNQVNVEGKPLTIAFIVDITERVAAETAFRKEKELSDTYFNQALSIFLTLDIEKNVTRINKKGAEVLGLTESKILGRNWTDEFVPLNQRKDVNAVFDKLINTSLPGIEFFAHDISIHGGRKRTVEWYANLISVDGQAHSLLLSGVDITYRKEIESSKTRAMMKGQEEERKRVAKELHDGLGQSLSAMNMHLGVLDKDKAKFSDKSLKSIKNLKELLENTIIEVKSISYDLMPKILESYGLVKALNYLCEVMDDSGKINLKMQTFGIKERMDPEVEVTLYRITQELINNVIKHAAARNISIQLIKHDQSLVLMVEDDGIGFETMRSKSDVKGLGLKNISTRVNSLNGSFYIDSLQGKGTTITIELPLDING